MTTMRLFSSSLALGAALFFALSGGAAFAQDQPAAGSPPPASAQTPAQNTQAAPPPAAQAPPVPAMQNRRAPYPQRLARTLAKRLSLTPGQESKIETILTARQQQAQSIRADATLTPRERRISLRGIFQDSDRRIKAILTAPQRQQYMRWKQEQRARREQRKQQQSDAPAGNL
ncbi:MAG: hypothetical protein ACLGPM_06480 [Acidobacteriota bacterium]